MLPFLDSLTGSEQAIGDTTGLRSSSPSASTTPASSDQTIILSAVIAILLVLLVLGGITFTIIIICMVKAKTHERPSSHDVPIEMKANEAYGPISGGRQLEENSAQDPEYEVIRE